jgi:acetolactate synthase-1/2/3 large subunit
VEATLRTGLESPKTVIMDFHVEPEEGVYPMVSPGAAISDMVLSK